MKASFLKTGWWDFGSCSSDGNSVDGKGKWLYVAGTFDGRQMNLFVDGQLPASLDGAADVMVTRKSDDLPGRCREAAVVTRGIGQDSLDITLKPGEEATIATAIVSNRDAADFCGTARKLVDGLTAGKIRKLTDRHRAWWAGCWAPAMPFEKGIRETIPWYADRLVWVEAIKAKLLPR